MYVSNTSIHHYLESIYHLEEAKELIQEEIVANT